MTPRELLERKVETEGWMRLGRYYKPTMQGHMRCWPGRRGVIVETRDYKGGKWLAEERPIEYFLTQWPPGCNG
jgi:hypothetical protein